MSQFVKDSNDTSDASSQDNNNTSSTFLKRLRQGVTETVNRPVSAIKSRNQIDGLSSVTSIISTIRSGLNISKENTNNSTSSPIITTDKKSNNSSRSAITSQYRINQFEKLLAAENIDLEALRKLSWNGVPSKYRTMVWQLMLGYLPTNKARRESAINRKRKEYFDSITMYYDVSETDRTTHEGEIHRQILVDLPRTSPHTPLYQQKPIQKAMERILYIWSIRHPASGYVQGMNDLLTPLLYISLHPFVPDVLRCDVMSLSNEILMDVEADAYWCLSKLLDNIQDHYTFSQPVLLKTFQDKIMEMQFQDILMFLQELPTANWTEEDVEPILSQAYILSTLFENSPSHLN
eukprot:gene19660-25575_t